MADMITRDEYLHHMELGEKALGLLPEEPGHIARHLMRQGVKAECGSSSRCALAEHLTAEAPLPAGFYWSVSTASFDIAMSKEGRTQEDFFHWNHKVRNSPFGPFDHAPQRLLTREQAVFVRQFDSGDYPSLVKE